MIRKVLVLALLLLATYATVDGFSSLTHNILRVQGWKHLVGCVEVPAGETMGYVLWTGVGPPTASTCANPGLEDAGYDIAALAAWVNGNSANSDLLRGITPHWKQQLFAWRNGSSVAGSGPYIAAAGPDTALFVAQLAILSWNNGRPDRTLQLAKSALAGEPREMVAHLLIRSIGVRTADDIGTIDELRQQIALVLPADAFNYATWFGAMVAFQDWERAQVACQHLRQHVQSPYEALAATCNGRLAFYQGDYMAAYSLLLPARRRMPNDPTVLTWVAICAKQLGRHDEAEKLFEQAIRYEQDSSALFNLYRQRAESLQALGKSNEAREAYENALHNAPDEQSRRHMLQVLGQLR